MTDGWVTAGPPGQLWVPLTTAAQVTGRKYRTLQTWANRGELASRVSPRGTLEVPLYAAVRLARQRPARDRSPASGHDGSPASEERAS